MKGDPPKIGSQPACHDPQFEKHCSVRNANADIDLSAIGFNSRLPREGAQIGRLAVLLTIFDFFPPKAQIGTLMYHAKDLKVSLAFRGKYVSYYFPCKTRLSSRSFY